MPDQPVKSDADRTRGSIKEAIGKITGDRKAIREGAAEKIAAAPNTSEAP
ncbi:MAG: CsbD family protein [Sphingomonas sp.]|nr:MAG: CsbD family protein [Sphingomonas sp.]